MSKSEYGWFRPPRRLQGVAFGLFAQGVSALGSLVSLAVLSRALGPEGRGIIAAALAPMLLLVVITAGGLSDALIHFTARNPSQSSTTLYRAILLMTAVTLPAIIFVWLWSQNSSIGNAETQNLIFLISLTALPAGCVVLLRARASALREWKKLAWEASLSTSLKVIALVLLWQSDKVSVVAGAAVLATETWIGFFVYLPGLKRQRHNAQPESIAPTYTKLMKFSLAGWPGVVAAGLLGQAAQLIMTPLSSVNALGDFVVALTIATLASRIAISVRDVVFSVESAGTDFGRVAQAGRTALLVTLMTATLIAVTVPWLLPVLVGKDFESAIVCSLIMLIFVVLNGSGSVAMAGLVAHGRPELRSIAVIVGASIYLGLLFLLVPHWGAVGASVATLAQAVPGLLAIFFTKKFYGVRSYDFLIPKREDILQLRQRLLILRSARRLATEAE